MQRRGVVRERQRHRRATRELADDEPPSGEKAPEVVQPLAPVDVRPARFRIKRRERRGRRRIAVRDERRDQQPDQQALARRARSRRERGEDTRADHRPQADHHRIAQAKLAREPTGRRSVACVSRVGIQCRYPWAICVIICMSVEKGRPDRLTNPLGGSERSERGGMFRPSRETLMIELVIDQRSRDLGGFEVGRVLPFTQAADGRTVHFLRSLRPGSFRAGDSAYRRCPAASAHRPVDRQLPVRRRDHASRQRRLRTGDTPRRGELDDRGPRHHAFRALRAGARRRRHDARHPGVGRVAGRRRRDRAVVRASRR